MKKLFTKYKPHYATGLTLAIPVVISQLGHTMVQTADSIVVGHFAGTIPLAAVSLVNGVFMVILIIGIGIAYAITPLIAQENGRDNHVECGRYLANGLLINLCVAFLLFLLVYFGSRYLLDHLYQSPPVVAQAKPYLLLLGMSIIPLMVFNTFKQFAEGLGFTKQAMLISIWGNIFNICLGITFVKGLFGIHPMGVRGVGYSTLADRCLMSIVMAVYVFRSPRFKIYLEGFQVESINWLRSFKLLSMGAPVAMQYAFEIGAFTAANLLIGSIGAAAQAAHQVAISLASITYMMSSGVSAAAAIKSGNHFGAGSYRELKLSAVANYHLVLAFMTCTAIIFATCNHLLPWIYTSDTTVINIAAQLLLIAALFQLFDGAQVVGLGILRGIGDVNIPTGITLIAYWIIGLPVGYILGITFRLGPTGIWLGLTLGLAVAAGLLYLRFRHITRKYELQPALTASVTT